ncbi:MAG TPA: adenylate/guanylate cyclase domain-containing protein [Stellaceae bacterium]|nr:adenylate/guanylate cyclase domain-containing protein [Stellaceae bacterium]
MSQTRRLAAILAADVAGYSRLMGVDEEGTLERLKALRRELVDAKIAEHHGRIVKTTGDGLLVEFASVVDAVRCAVEVQQAMPQFNTGVAADNRIEFRMGINLGDVIVEGDDLYGDGVNIAARVEALADAGGVFVSNTVHDHVRDRLPFAFEDLGEQQVKNIARPVRVYRVRDTAAKSPAAPALPLPDKPSIAVLPFANMSGDPEQEYFADGMVEEIITALSRIRWLFVIARNSSFTYKGQAIDVKQLGRELGVRYILEGSVRKAGQRVRITAQLIDALTGTHLWADRFDGSLEDVFDLQERVATSVAGVIEPALHAAETARSAARPTNDLTAYDLYLRGYAVYLSSRKQQPEALRLLEQAIERDPHYGPALALSALCLAQRCVDGWSDDPEAESRKGTDFARRALQVARDDPNILAYAAMALAYFGEDIGAMMALVDRALKLNPSFALGWFTAGALSVWAGQPDRAIEHAEAALRLNPRGIVRSSNVIGAAHLVSRRFEEAVPKLLLAIEEDPTHPTPYRNLAACYAHMGRLVEAREIIARLRGITPVVIPSATYLRNAEHRELLLSGLRLAAGET